MLPISNLLWTFIECVALSVEESPYLCTHIHTQYRIHIPYSNDSSKRHRTGSKALEMKKERASRKKERKKEKRRLNKSCTKRVTKKSLVQKHGKINPSRLVEIEWNANFSYNNRYIYHVDLWSGCPAPFNAMQADWVEHSTWTHGGNWDNSNAITANIKRCRPKADERKLERNRKTTYIDMERTTYMGRQKKCENS